MVEESYEVLVQPLRDRAARPGAEWTVAGRHDSRVEAERQFSRLRDSDPHWSQLVLVLSRWDETEGVFQERVLRRIRQGQASLPAPGPPPRPGRAAQAEGEWKTRAAPAAMPVPVRDYARPIVAVVGLLGVLVLLSLR